jgi:hypothetical protein
MIRMKANPAATVRVRKTAKELICADLGTTYRVLSAEASTASGSSPSFVIFDELAQCRGPRSPLFDALETATAAQESLKAKSGTEVKVWWPMMTTWPRVSSKKRSTSATCRDGPPNADGRGGQIGRGGRWR